MNSQYSKGSGTSKLVFVNRYFYPDQSATSQLLTDLTAALVESGFEVHVICSRQMYDQADARLDSKAVKSGVMVHRMWTTHFGRRRLLGRAIDYATFYGSAAFKMIRLLRPGDTLVAKTDPPLMSIPAVAVTKFKSARLVNWLQDIFPEVASVLGANPLPHGLNRTLRRCRDLSLHHAHANVVLGERMREKLRRAGVPTGKIHVIENWANVDTEAPKPVANSRFRSTLGLDNQFVVGYSGNLGRAHEFQTLLEAAELLCFDTQIVFLMIGSGTGMEELKRAVASRKLANFRFQPYQPRESLSDCLAAANVHWVSLRPALEGLIVPSKFYGILAAARPIVFVGDTDGELARIIRKSGCGATVQPGAARHLADLLKLWKADNEQCEAMGGRGYRYYGEYYSAQRAADQWINMLKSFDRVGDAWPPIPSNR